MPYRIASVRELNEQSLDNIKKHEGWAPCTYDENLIGYGHKIKPSDNFTDRTCISEDQGADLLKKDVAEASTCVAKMVKPELNDNEFGAITSWTYNVGCNKANKSTLVKRLNAGDKGAVCGELKKWNKATVDGVRVELEGITQRRKDECELFNTPGEYEYEFNCKHKRKHSEYIRFLKSSVDFLNCEYNFSSTVDSD